MHTEKSFYLQKNLCKNVCCKNLLRFRVLYFSIHRYEYGEYWPHLRESDYNFIGEGDGLGFNINVPLNKVSNKLYTSVTLSLIAILDC